MSKKIKVSVIVVNYQADEYVRRIQKVCSQDPSLECIVIDNSDGAAGYGAGCNRGAEISHGELLLFTNPDVNISVKTIHALTNHLHDHPQTAVVGPQILNEQEEIQITCSTIPTAWEAAVLFSWLHHLPVFAALCTRYRLNGFNHMTSRPVPVLNGSCFMMRRSDFREIGGFDERLFLYFEEFDLAKRVKDQLEKSGYFLATSSIIHYGQKSTQQATSVSEHFKHSRCAWLQKHYAWRGYLADAWIRFWELGS